MCSVHLQQCTRRSPLSGYEPVYEPLRWNKDSALRLTHNCFSYAMNVNDPKQIEKCRGKNEECDTPFHQPGSVSKYEPFSDKPKTCPNMVARIIGDNPTIMMSSFEDRCPVGSSKIALVVDEDEDYHFLRQDRSGYWSQKSGARPVTDKDAGGHRIWDPQLCDLNYKKKDSNLEYNVFCGMMCVPRNKKLFMKTGGGRSRRRR